MAGESQVTRAERKAELISELAWSRASLSRHFQDAREDMNLVAHLKNSVVHRKTAWLTGAAITGWILSRLPGHKKKQSGPKVGHEKNSKERSERNAFMLAVLGAFVNLLKPLLTTFATRKIHEWTARNGGGERRALR